MMIKATATYVAPPGDSKVVEMGGVTFFDGKSVELDNYHNTHLIEKLKTNQNFDVTVGEDDKQPMKVEKKRGRPSNADIAAAKEAAEKADAEAKAAAEKAKIAKADHDAVTKEAGKAEPVAAKATPVATPAPAAVGQAPNPSFNAIGQNTTTPQT